MRKVLLSILFLITLSIISGCEKNENSTNDNNGSILYETGVFVANEGLFPSGSGSISYFNRTTGSVVQDIFEKENNRPLGNIVQSMEVFNSRGYIVVNNASKVEVVQLATFKSVGVIDNLTSPRYFLGINNNKGYVSNWANQVSVVDLNNLNIIKNIQTGTGPDKMIKVNDKVFVLNIGGWSIDSTITVIDCNTDSVITTIQVAPKPDGVVEDKNGWLWVICSGHGWNGFPAPGDSEGHLMAINTDDYTIVTDIPFPNIDKHPEKLAINNTKDILYYNHPDGIFNFNISAGSLNALPLIQYTNAFYNIDFDVITGNIYASDPINYNQKGWIFRFNGSTGEKVDSFQAGIIPGNFCFE
ncbi:YncE family protein [Bacteroidota bacterium]